MTLSDQHSRYTAYGLFKLVPYLGGKEHFKVTCFGYALSDAIPYDEAFKKWRYFVDQTQALDGDARMFAIAWATAAQAQDNLTAVQARCTELREALLGLVLNIKMHHDGECPGIMPSDCIDAIYESAEIATAALRA